MSTLIIIQARMNSKRLPGKVLKELYGKPLLLRLYNRLLQTGLPVTVATSLRKENAPILEMCKSNHINVIRGDENDVMDRLIMAGEICGSDDIVRVTADNPLTCPDVLKLLVQTHKKRKSEYTYIDNLPRGVKSEVINLKALKALHEAVKEPELRENMTPALMMLKKVKVLTPYEWYAPEESFTVDTPEDYTKVSQIFDYYKGYPPNLEGLLNMHRRLGDKFYQLA